MQFVSFHFILSISFHSFCYHKIALLESTACMFMLFLLEDADAVSLIFVFISCFISIYFYIYSFLFFNFLFIFIVMSKTSWMRIIVVLLFITVLFIDCVETHY